ncbi:MAG: DUF479 domain-containing protein [Gammaproteobacteria bacterium]|nr:DUF479 domain-containing protein [Gammaproteobacteria bacterium]
MHKLSVVIVQVGDLIIVRRADFTHCFARQFPLAIVSPDRRAIAYNAAMNYLSHLYFSNRTPLSMTGNLMGDFKPGKALRERLPKEIILGIKNHRLVDRTTDRFKPVKSLRELFAPERRRFAGVVTDIAFDYFLVKHWQRFDEGEFGNFVQHCYDGLSECEQWMPARMRYVAGKMQEHDLLSTYGTLQGIAEAIDMVSGRLRFANNMQGSIVEVEKNYQQIELVFLQLFEHLQITVDAAALENVKPFE